MIEQLVKMFGIDDISFNLSIKKESIKRAIRYARKVSL